jgi:ribosome-associated protein
MPDEIPILGELRIPAAELRYETGPSSGPGGQHVNKTETRVTLVFDLEASGALEESQRATLRQALAGRINKEGELRISSQSSRSQKKNREDATERFSALLREALTPKPPRKSTRVPKGARIKRMDSKRKQGDKKRARRRPDWDRN